MDIYQKTLKNKDIRMPPVDNSRVVKVKFRYSMLAEQASQE